MQPHGEQVSDRMHLIQIRKVASSTRLFIADNFILCAEMQALSQLVDKLEGDPTGFATRKRDTTGLSFELPVNTSPVLEALSRRIHGALGFGNDCGDYFRYRHYRTGESHGLHYDNYEIAGNFLVATAMLWLREPETGGETRFPYASPYPFLLQPRRGRVAVWLNYLADGSIDRCAMHEALPVSSGDKITLTEFIYAPVGPVPAFSSGLKDEAVIEGVTFELNSSSGQY